MQMIRASKLMKKKKKKEEFRPITFQATFESETNDISNTESQYNLIESKKNMSQSTTTILQDFPSYL